MLTYSPSKFHKSKKYFWELCKFAKKDSVQYKEMKQPENLDLFVYKQGHPDIIVKIINPTEKIHGWVCKTIEICQKRNDNPLVFHWKCEAIEYQGQLIPSLLQNFNQFLKIEIQEGISRRTPALERWISSKIDDVMIVQTRSSTSFEDYHAFLKVSLLLRTRFTNYYEMRAWRSNQWEGLLTMARVEQINAGGSYPNLFDEIFQFIQSFEVIRQAKYDNMFSNHHQNKKVTKQHPKDDFQKKREREILQKYHLYEYIDHD